MPVYLCQPGEGSREPWRHEIQVYSAPCDLDATEHDGDAANNEGGHQGYDGAAANRHNQQQQRHQMQAQHGQRDAPNVTAQPVSFSGNTADEQTVAAANARRGTHRRRSPVQEGVPVRSVKHSEVVLVDDVCLAFNRYWLRLRWTGRNGGFAGYIALGRLGEGNLYSVMDGTSEISIGAMSPEHLSIDVPTNNIRPRTGSDNDTPREDAIHRVFDNQNEDVHERENDAVADGRTQPSREGQEQQQQQQRQQTDDVTNSDPSSQVDERTAIVESMDFEREDVDTMRDDMDEPQDNATAPAVDPIEASSSALVCLRSGIEFPSSVAMKLMLNYTDGLSPPVSSAAHQMEPVFCRICREGLHDDSDDQQPSPAMENDNDGQNAASRHGSSSNEQDGDAVGTASNEEGMDNLDDDDSVKAAGPTSNILQRGPVHPHPRYHPNPSASANPLLAPCQCSGSMAFVHYLCLEQWRCWSRHPAARGGLNCETCGFAYALPPSARPAVVNNDHGMEPMPPHVLLALRQPHIWWRIGTWIVRQQRLKYIAPVIISPIVALYCRARRLLKKKGVSRRRWACSLCRQRARWKCVRCLRSYYCSRQCQNVSWHIVHKHVCYKPHRFWASVAVYSLATMLLFPGMKRDPLMYDLAFVLIPTSFYVMALLGGGIATVMKKTRGLDLRGRVFELVVVVMTLWLLRVSWGLVGGFFGDANKCHGIVGSVQITDEAVSSSLLNPLRLLVLKPTQKYFLMWDKAAQMIPLVRGLVCSRPMELDDGCFEHLPDGNADFFLEEHGGGKCASDLFLVSSIWASAGLVAMLSWAVKRRERQRRAQRRQRPHQD